MCMPVETHLKDLSCAQIKCPRSLYFVILIPTGFEVRQNELNLVGCSILKYLESKELRDRNLMLLDCLYTTHLNSTKQSLLHCECKCLLTSKIIYLFILYLFIYWESNLSHVNI
jgi:hypothetical protein